MYLHRISDNRVGGGALRSIQFFQQLCGDDALQNCAIVTNMWSQVNAEVGQARENELKSTDIFFKSALDRKATMFRHDNTKESALAIITHLISKTSQPLAIQRELIDERKPIYETQAGKILLGEIATLEQRHQQKMVKLRQELQEAQEEQDEEAERDIQEERERLLQEQAKLVNEKTRFLESGGRADDVKKRSGGRWERLRRASTVLIGALKRQPRTQE